MKTIQFYLLVACSILMTLGVYAQPPGRMDDGPGMKPPNERIERFKKLRMIEVLKLSEDESVRFFAKQSAHETKIHDLMNERNETLDDIDDLLDKKSNKDIQKLTDKILDVDQRIFQERQRFQTEIQKMLTSEQFANFLLFEREFGKQMRGAMEDIMKGRRDHWRGGKDDE